MIKEMENSSFPGLNEKPQTPLDQINTDVSSSVGDQNSPERTAFGISPHYEASPTQHSSTIDIDRSDWTKRLLQSHPEVKHLRETVLPLERAIEFGREYLAEDRMIDPAILLSLVSQHLHTLGLVETQSCLHSEWNEPINFPTSLSYSQLNLLFQHGIYRAEHFWELAMPSKEEKGNHTKEYDAQVAAAISEVVGGKAAFTGDDTPLKDDPFDETSLILRDPGILVAASINQCIWILTTSSKYNTPTFFNAFCFTSTLFIKKGASFLTKIRDRFTYAIENETKNERDKSISLIYKLVSSWLRDSITLIETVVAAAARAFIDHELKGNYPELCIEENEGESVDTNEGPNFAKAPKVELGTCTALWGTDFTIFSLPPVEIARQLTIWIERKFNSVQRTEYIVFNDNPDKAPNLQALSVLFDAFGNLIVKAITAGYENSSPKIFDSQAAGCTYFMKLAQELFTLQNYLGAKIVLLGLHRAELSSILQQNADNINGKLYQWQESQYENYTNHTLEEDIDQAVEEAKATGNPFIPPLHLPNLNSFFASSTFTSDDVINGKKVKIVDIIRIQKVYDYMIKYEKYRGKFYNFLHIAQIQEELEKNVKELINSIKGKH